MSSQFPERIIIHQPWGGLGDNLAFSTLPELFAARGIQSFVSTHNVLRNPEIGQLVWDCNPFISGYSDEEPNAGACMPIHNISRRFAFLERIELAHGLEPTSRYPKIYYRPTRRPDLENIVLIDLGSISVLHRRSGLRKYIDTIISHYEYDRTLVQQVRFETAIADDHRNYSFDEFPSFVPNSIFDYCDALASCKAFITVHSGAQSLAIALRGETSKPVIHCYCTPMQFNGRDYIFSNVEYYVAENVLARGRISRSVLKRMPRTVRSFIDSRT